MTGNEHDVIAHVSQDQIKKMVFGQILIFGVRVLFRLYQDVKKKSKIFLASKIKFLVDLVSWEQSFKSSTKQKPGN